MLEQHHANALAKNHVRYFAEPRGSLPPSILCPGFSFGTLLSQSAFGQSRAAHSLRAPSRVLKDYLPEPDLHAEGGLTAFNPTQTVVTILSWMRLESFSCRPAANA